MIKSISAGMVVLGLAAATLSGVPAYAAQDDTVLLVYPDVGAGDTLDSLRIFSGTVFSYTGMVSITPVLTAPLEITDVNTTGTVSFRAESNAPFTNTDGKVLFGFGDAWTPTSSLIQLGAAVTAELTGPDPTDIAVTATKCQVDWTQDGGNYICGTDDAGTRGPVAYIFGAAPNSGGDSSSPTSGAGPAAHMQQFPKSPSMTCDEAQPEGLDWAGAPSGGWGESWARWPKDGKGGEVCVRTLFYNNSTGKWDVR